MKLRAVVGLVVAVLVGACLPSAPVNIGPATARCDREGPVDVHVVNRSFSDVRITFGNDRRVRAAPGLETTTYRNLARSDLSGWISWTIARGGMQVGKNPPVAGTSLIDCSDATLIINPGARAGIFFGADLRRSSDR